MHTPVDLRPLGIISLYGMLLLLNQWVCSSLKLVNGRATSASDGSCLIADMAASHDLLTHSLMSSHRGVDWTDSG